MRCRVLWRKTIGAGTRVRLGFPNARPVVSERSEFRRSVKESLSGPVLANRSDGIKTGIGIERKKIDLLLFEQMIDFGKNNNLGKIYNKLTPNLAKIFTENYFSYEYLIKSKQNFPSPEDLIKDFESKGFKLKKRQDFIFGVISSQIMTK